MKGLKVKGHPDLIVGLENADDAGVFRLNAETALIQTLDFLTPVTDSPYEFGQIAAANSLSDVYAMGGKPLTAMNIVCFPANDLPEDVLKETMQGGIDKIHEAGAILVGGHSVDDPEFKFGLSVTGLVHPDKVLTNHCAMTGDLLILTKPVGSGIIATAIKAKMADPETSGKMVEIMSELNKKASETMLEFNVTSCTDITGFGLAGHILEMARGGKKEITLFAEQVPVIPKAREFAMMGLVPAGAYNNKKFCEPFLNIDQNLDKFTLDLMFDPQTSGGLIFSLNKEDAGRCVKLMCDKGLNASIIGEIGKNDQCGTISII